MNTSLLSRILTDDEKDAVLLDRWRAERAAEKALATAWENDAPRTPPATVDIERLAAAVDPYDSALEPGQIRILAPELTADPGNIPYVAVLESWEPGIWLVAPFSPYSTPATEGEMSTGLSPVGQRVLQCWNARTAAESVIARSRVAGTLPRGVLEDARALFRHAMSGAPLPESFSSVVGPPVLSEADPRREHFVESAVRYEPITAATRATEAALARAERLAELKVKIAERFAGLKETVGTIADGLKDFVFVPAHGTPAAALAAGDKARETTETFRVPAFGVELDVKHAPEEGKVRFVVYGTDGERDTVKLEEFAVVAKDGSLVGTIEDGVLVAEASTVADGFLLLDPGSLEPVALEPKEE